MVYCKLALLAFIACLCQVTDAQNSRRARPSYAASRACAPALARANLNNRSARYGYSECNLEAIISKLVNALIYTLLYKDGGVSGAGVGGVGGGSGVSTGGGNVGSTSGGNVGSTSGGNVGSTSGGNVGGTSGASNGGSDDSSLLKSLLNLELALGRTNLLDLSLLGNSGGGGRNTGSSGSQNSGLSILDLDLLGQKLLELDLLD